MMMGRFRAVIWRILAISVTILIIMAGYSTIHFVSAPVDCSDPGSPLHGGKTVSNGGGRFPVGTVVPFYCNPNYTLSGVPKIKCSVWKNYYYWSGKVPKCIYQGCPMPPPTFAHANITTHPVLNSKGSYVDYSCNDGYLVDYQQTRILCDKDPSSHGYKWSGNFTCMKITCGRPPYPSTGHGNYTFFARGRRFYATYLCHSGYVFVSGGWLLYSITASCDNQRGHWSLTVPITCVKYCSATEVQPLYHWHGRIVSRKPQYKYFAYDEGDFFRFAQGVEVTFACDSTHRLEGRAKLRCLENGQWDGNRPRCVRSKCRSPGYIDHGRIYALNDTVQQQGYTVFEPTDFPIGIIVTFECIIGYKLRGPHSRQCLPSGVWTEDHNPTCQKSELTCGPPPLIPHGYYDHAVRLQQKYLLNDRLVYTCRFGYYLWGEETVVCRPVHSIGTWLPGNCLSYGYCSIHCECLPKALYDEKCIQKTGHHATFKKNSYILICDPSSPGTADDREQTKSTPAVFIRKSNGNDLDKMTTVVATAGSTLGALVVLLTALVCFHRSRRFRHLAFRSQRYSEDDRIAIITANPGDVHFILPSYDEAISQVQTRRQHKQ